VSPKHVFINQVILSKSIPAVFYDHTVVWYSSHKHHGDWLSTITSV